MYHLTLYRRYLVATLALGLLVVLLQGDAAFAGGFRRPYEYVNPADLEIRLVPERTELIAGEIATFTIRIRNRSDKTVHVTFPTGQRWDMAGFHFGTQIFRWSQGWQWEESKHSIPIKAGKTEESPPIGWETVDRHGRPLPQGMYYAVGMVMCSPRRLMTNQVGFRLVPPVIENKGDITTYLNRTFELQVPRFINGREVSWVIRYDYNDNRIDQIGKRQDLNVTTLVFHAKRIGHVTMRLFAKPIFKLEAESLQRLTYRINVLGSD
jgi:hypothetical protein